MVNVVMVLLSVLLPLVHLAFTKGPWTRRNVLRLLLVYAVGYAEYAYEVAGADSWINHRYFETRGMRPLFVEEIAVHPEYHGLGIGSFMFEQIDHAARLRGCTHIVLDVAENNEEALRYYRKRNFHKIDAAIFLARKIDTADDLLGPRKFRLRAKKTGE